MTCNCKNISNLFYYEESPFVKEGILTKVDSSSWSELLRCNNCGQLWRIDIPDRLQERFVVKLDRELKWSEFDISNLIKDKILQLRGGTTSAICIWKDCTKQQVQGVVYCIDHLFQTGVRK